MAIGAGCAEFGGREFFGLRGGIVLLVATVVALVLANSGAADATHDFWMSQVGIRLGSFSFVRPLEFWVNDGLMTIFFFVVGLEIKQELVVGELTGSDAPGQQCAEDRPRGRADDHVCVAGVEPVHLLEGAQRTRGPRGTQHTPAAEHDAAAATSSRSGHGHAPPE